MSDNATAARRSAIYLLDQILGEGRLLSECLAAGALDRLGPEDRARAQRLALQTLRGLERADRLLDNHLNRTPALTVHNALRLGAVELCHGEAAHGVVNSMVEIVGRSRKHGRLKGLVNAVLRKVAAEGPDAWPKMRVPRLPEWLRGPLIMAWGAEAVASMEQAHFSGAPLDLTLKPGASGPGEALPTGSMRIQDPGQVSALPGFDQGDWWVQDAAAALPVRILAPKAGETVLDLCAAPGGKTLQLAAAGAKVTALDISDSRLERVRENLNRTGLKAQVIAGDALEHQGQYDAILLDAPCSATGTIRRHPDLPFAKDGSEFGGLIELQAQMLAHAWTLLKPGGRLVYCTCSLLPDEGEVQIEEALDQYPDMSIEHEALGVTGVDQSWITEEGGLRLRPDYWVDRGGMDGFYIACLNKSA
ncbi:Ribosomal RNA small subunit methyltransferase B [Ruegeria denitrificans]|uniref:Ribosomal RNA small subunit methyltransferase B n=1 Tax=Ruegeria denitrificans TaxID=1715692 RepID=A0A0P1IDS9_9RHOB|nr:transcription antitermination factor NusB [Ruegeria denitrificans]CUK07245.1 Ribosomal RNA small subunit methyltransferase B [Ruegeria denitrificans]